LWECPQVFEIDGAHVLVTSVWEDDILHHVAYGVGSYEDGRFHPRQWHRLTYGDSYYAPSFFRDRDGQPCLIFWLRGPLDEQSGWASAHSIPHRLSLVDDRLVTEPHPSVHERISAIEGDAAETHPELLSWEPSRGEVQISSEAGLLATLRGHEGCVEILE